MGQALHIWRFTYIFINMMDGISYGPEGPRALNSWSSHKKEVGSFRRSKYECSLSQCLSLLQSTTGFPYPLCPWGGKVILLAGESGHMELFQSLLCLPCFKSSQARTLCRQNPEYTGAKRYGWSGAAGYQEALLPFHYLLNWLYMSIPHQTTELVSFPFSPNITFSSCPNSNNETLRKKIISTFGD